MIKRLLTILLFLAGTVSVQAKVIPQFNEGVELMGLIGMLSGAREYNLCDVPSYSTSAAARFEAMKEHQAVALLKRLRHEQGIAYDAVAGFGLHLVIASDGAITFSQEYTPGSDNSFDRWEAQDREAMLVALNDFYCTSGFHEWYLGTDAIRTATLKAFDATAQNIDFEWFDTFFGPLQHAVNRLWVSLFVGPNNYGCDGQLKDGIELHGPIIGCIHQRETGELYVNDPIDIVVHEFCHAYCNPLNANHWDQLEESVTRAFAMNRDLLKTEAYGSARIMLDETFVRSSVIRYMLTHGTQQSREQLILEEEEGGFVLTRAIVGALEQREEQAAQYPTMTEFMSRYVEAINAFTPEQYLMEQRERYPESPRLVKCSIADGAENVPSGILPLTFTFDRRLDGVHYGLNEGRADAALPEVAPREPFCEWSEDLCSWTLFVQLQPDTPYSFSIHIGDFRSESGQQNMDTHFFSFKTK